MLPLACHGHSPQRTSLAHWRAVGSVIKLPEHVGPMSPCWGSYATVKDVDATCAQAALLDGKVVFGPMDVPSVGRLAVIVDPQGAAINVMTCATPGG